MSGVSSHIVERIPRQTLPSGYGDDSGGGSTDELLIYATDRFGPVASFSGTYRADNWELVIQRTPIESSEYVSTCRYLFIITFAYEGYYCCKTNYSASFDL